MTTTYGTLDAILSRLMFQKKMRAMDLARALDIPQPTIHRIATGKSTTPHASTLEPVAKYFNITVDQLTGKAPLQDANSWVNALLPANTQIARQIPLLQWDELKDADFSKPVQSKHHIVSAPDFPEAAFAVKMNDSSMSPTFVDTDILILNPHKKIKDRGYYLAKLGKSQQCVFRQLLIDVDQQYLKPLHPDLNAFSMRLLTDQDQILAGLIEVRKDYGRND